MSWLERNIASLAGTMEHATHADALSRRAGLLQGLDARAKILGLGALMVAAVGARSLPVVVGLGLSGVVLSVCSRLPLHRLAGRAWLGVLGFTGVIAFPALFLTPGPVLGVIPGLGWQVTTTGLRTAALLLARAETTTTLALLLVFSTPWPHVLKALRVLGVPVVLVAILAMTCRYIFLLLRVALDFFVGRRSRLIAPLPAAQQRQMVAGTAGVLLGKSLALSEEVYQAMRSRGFRGEVYPLEVFRWRPRDGWAVAGFLALAALALWRGLP